MARISGGIQKSGEWTQAALALQDGGGGRGEGRDKVKTARRTCRSSCVSSIPLVCAKNGSAEAGAPWPFAWPAEDAPVIWDRRGGAGRGVPVRDWRGSMTGLGIAKEARETEEEEKGWEIGEVGGGKDGGRGVSGASMSEVD